MTGYPYGEETPEPEGPVCEVDGETIGTYGGGYYWHCGQPGTITVDGTLMCEDHAGERGYGPKQEEYGFDPDDGLNPTPGAELTATDSTGATVCGCLCHNVSEFSSCGCCEAVR